MRSNDQCQSTADDETEIEGWYDGQGRFYSR
jgi:hypothetical protein